MDELELTLPEIMSEIFNIEEGLFDGTIDFVYDNLMCAMKPGHPGEILGEITYEVYCDLENPDIPIKKVNRLIKYLKRFRDSFQVKELETPIHHLKQYVAERKNSDPNNANA